MRRLAAPPVLAALLSLPACGDSTTGTAGQTSSASAPDTTSGTTADPGTTLDLPTTSASASVGETSTTSAPTTLDPTTGGGESGDPTLATEPSTDGPATCDDNPDCIGPDSCAACSLADACAAALAACDATPGDECNQYANCSGGCGGDQACLNACYIAYPNGYDPAWALFDCSVCDACPTSCASASAYCANGGGGPGKGGETCDDIGDCTLCNACSVTKDCAQEVQNCLDDPQCQPYQDCVQACPANDVACVCGCEDMYPDGYASAWAQFDCAMCEACPASCPTSGQYCMDGGGGPPIDCPEPPECANNSDCDQLYGGDAPFCIDQYCYECTANQHCGDGYPFCVDNACVECTKNDHCGDPNAPSCVDNSCE